ncbi:putative reverse transcriptase domain-containing protein [Tanacetum coccineum]
MRNVTTWKALMKLMTEVYCPRNEIQKTETELWNLAMRGNDLTAYTQRLQDAIRIANNLMDQKLKGYAARDAENKRRFDNDPRDNRVQQPPFKSASCTTTVHVLLDVETARRLVTKQETVGPLLR